MESIVSSLGVVLGFLLSCSILVYLNDQQPLGIALQCIALGISVAMVFMGDSALSSKENLEIIEAALRDVRQRTASLSQLQNLAESEREQTAGEEDLPVPAPAPERRSTLMRVGISAKQLLLRRMSSVVDDKSGDEPSSPMTPYAASMRRMGVIGRPLSDPGTEIASAPAPAAPVLGQSSNPALARSASIDKRRSSFVKKIPVSDTEPSSSKSKLAPSPAPDLPRATSAVKGSPHELSSPMGCPGPQDVETVPTADLEGPESVLHIRNLMDKTVVVPNYSIPVTMDSELFEGEMIMMMRTVPANKTFGPLFAGSRRLWWIQFQGKFKRPVNGDLYMGLEIDVFPQPGIMMRTFISVLLAFMKKIAGGRLYYQSSNGVVDTSRKKMGAESPFIVVPLAIGAGKVTVTTPGEMEPKIGTAHDEEPEDYKFRQKTGKLRQGYTMGNTYTFSIYNAFVDFLCWKITNIPGCRPLDLRMMCNGRPFSISLYELNMEQTGRPHYDNSKAYMANVQLQHESQMSPQELQEAQEQRRQLQRQAEKQHNEALLELALQRMAETDRSQREERKKSASDIVFQSESELASESDALETDSNGPDRSLNQSRSPGLAGGKELFSDERLATPPTHLPARNSQLDSSHRALTTPVSPVGSFSEEQERRRHSLMEPATVPSKGKVSKLKRNEGKAG